MQVNQFNSIQFGSMQVNSMHCFCIIAYISSKVFPLTICLIYLPYLGLLLLFTRILWFVVQSVLRGKWRCLKINNR